MALTLKLRAADFVAALPWVSLMVAAMPLQGVEVGGANIYPNVLVTVGVAALMSGRSMLRAFQKRVFDSAYSRLLIAFALVNLLSAVHVFTYRNFGLTAAYLLAYIGSLGTFFLAGHVLVRSGVADQVALRYSRGLVAFAVGLTIIFLWPGGSEYLRTGALQFNRNDYAMIVLQALCVLGGTALSARSFSLRTVCLGVVLLFGLMLSANRGAVIGLLGGIGLLWAAGSAISFQKRLLIAVAVVLMLFALIVTEHRLIQSIVAPNEFQDVARMAILGVAKQIFYENWVLGVGVGNYWDAYLDVAATTAPVIPGLPSNIHAAVYEIARPPHNLYLRVGVELGIAGIILLMLANLSAVYYFLNRLQRGGWASRAGVLYSTAAFLHSAVYEGYIYPFHFVFLAVLMCCVEMSCGREAR